MCRNNLDCLPYKEAMSKGQIENATIYENQNICRLVCGRYGSLWPRPTGFCVLEKSIIDVNTNLIR